MEWTSLYAKWRLLIIKAAWPKTQPTFGTRYVRLSYSLHFCCTEDLRQDLMICIHFVGCIVSRESSVSLTTTSFPWPRSLRSATCLVFPAMSVSTMQCRIDESGSNADKWSWRTDCKSRRTTGLVGGIVGSLTRSNMLFTLESHLRCMYGRTMPSHHRTQTSFPLLHAC